MVIWLDYS